jgi:hypothetical protein
MYWRIKAVSLLRIVLPLETPQFLQSPLLEAVQGLEALITVRIIDISLQLRPAAAVQ